MARTLIENQEYFAERAREEAIKAASSCDTTSAKAHLELAEEHQKRADELARFVPTRP